MTDRRSLIDRRLRFAGLIDDNSTAADVMLARMVAQINAVAVMRQGAGDRRPVATLQDEAFGQLGKMVKATRARPR